MIKPMTKEHKQTVLDMMRVFYVSPAVLSNGSEEIFNNDIENCINKILESGIVDYEEKWCKSSKNHVLEGASYTSLCEQQLMYDVDEEFEDEFEL